MALVFAVSLAGAALIPVDQCPDESGRMYLVNHMVYQGTLPTGNEPHTIMEQWGFSYALRPFLPQMISAVFMRIALVATDSDRTLLLAARLTSVVSVTACCAFVLGMGHRLFRQHDTPLLFAAIVCLLPQVTFLGMYVNDDAPSLAAVAAMLYFLVRGYDEGWQLLDCVGLALTMSVCLLTYYSVYGWVLSALGFCVVAMLRHSNAPGNQRLIVHRLALIGAICMLLAGWFFVRNAVLHEGDPFGLRSEMRSRELAMAQGAQLYQPIVPASDGISFLEFLGWKNGEILWMSACSFVGTFGYMLIYLPPACYGLYFCVFALGVIGYLAAVIRQRPNRRDALLVATMLLASCITVALHLWASYARDYEPQGRYVITLTLLLGYMLSYGVDRTETRLPLARLATIGWIALFAVSCLGTMTRMLG